MHKGSLESFHKISSSDSEMVDYHLQDQTLREKENEKLPLYVCTVCGKFKSRTRKEVIMHMSRHDPEVLKRLNLDLVLETAKW